MTSKTRTTYKELDLVSIPEDIPELGIEAGRRGTVDSVYSDAHGGQGMYVEVSREDGTTVGFVQLEDSGASGSGEWCVIAYSNFD